MAAYINDRFVENDQALLHVSDLSMQRGYGVFDFFRTINGIPLFINDHLDRFYSSALAMHLPVKQKPEELIAIVHELIKRSSLAEAGVRIMLTGGNSPDSYNLAEPNLVITCNPVRTAGSAEFEKGYTIITQEHQRELPHIKSINYLMAVWLQPILKEKKADDVLYVKNNIITEFPRSNVFIVTKEDKLVTPENNVLAGITRKNVLALAIDIIDSEIRDITKDELLNAAEVFLTSTTKKILPVLKINETVIGNGRPGKFTTRLYNAFLELENAVVHFVNR